MQTRRTTWSGWAQFLQRWGLTEPVAVLLEATGPLTVLIAQFVYISQPFLRRVLPGEEWSELALMLEDQDECRAFAFFLRQEEDLS